MNKTLSEASVNRLFEAILTLETVEECGNFFEDIGTIAEIKAFAQRLEVAQMLKSGSTYGDIAAQTGASTATISRVNKCLNYGTDGYNLVLERLAGRREGLPAGQEDQIS